MSLLNFLFFLTELDPPFGLKMNLMSKINNKQLGFFVNERKKYMVRKIMLLLQTRDISIKVNKSRKDGKYVKFNDAYSELIKRGFDQTNDGKFKPPKPKCTAEVKKKERGKNKHKHEKKLE